MSRRPVPALSELSVTEFLTLARLGFFPHGLVIGASVYDAGSQYDWSVATAEVGALSHALRAARHLAIGRMRQQAASLAAEGVVDVRLRVEHHLWRGGRQVVKFVAMGTAIGFDREAAPAALRDAPSLRLADGSPFTSDLTGPDFVALLRGGERPITVATGTCVYGLDPRELRRYRGQNAEITAFTQAFFDAREAAMDRLQQDLFAEWPPGHPDAPSGIVGMTVTESTYGGAMRQGPPIVEFFAIGTAVAPLAPNDPRRSREPPRPRLVVPLDR
jgi:uncharacterized protein YbjQ (UPF0145 family)